MLNFSVQCVILVMNRLRIVGGNPGAGTRHRFVCFEQDVCEKRVCVHMRTGRDQMQIIKEL
jgi:hypothetical protein